MRRYRRHAIPSWWWLLDTHGPGYPAIEAILVNVERALPVDSPAYAFGHAKEEDLVRSWAATYGVTSTGDQAGIAR